MDGIGIPSAAPRRPNRTPRTSRSAKVISIERLEARALLTDLLPIVELSPTGLIQVTGTPGGDTVFLGREGDSIFVDVKGPDGSVETLAFPVDAVLGARVHGLGGNDSIEARTFPRHLVVRGGPGNDVVAGGEGPDTLSGGPGNDVVLGRGGDDRVRGGRGDDVVGGGPGEDTITGGPGRDLLDGLDEKRDIFPDANPEQDRVLYDAVLCEPTLLPFYGPPDDQTGEVRYRDEELRFEQVTYHGEEGVFYRMVDSAGTALTPARRANGTVIAQVPGADPNRVHFHGSPEWKTELLDLYLRIEAAEPQEFCTLPGDVLPNGFPVGNE